MITYQAEKFADCYQEADTMLRMQYEEITTCKEAKVYNPNYYRYQELEDMGMLRVFTARDDGNLIGYFVSFVTPHLHYSDTMFALNDILFIHPTWRKGSCGYRLIKLATEDLKNFGAAILIIHMKVDYPFRNLLIRLGFTLTEENWERVL